MDRARIDDGLLLPGDPLGLGPGPHEACAIPALLSDDERARIVDDHLAELRADISDLEPLALVGAPGMKALGATWRDALTCDAMLLLDRSTDPPRVLGWDGNPWRGLIEIAPSLDELT